MNLTKFDSLVRQISSDEEAIDFSRKYFLHGTPYIFESKESDFYEFRKRIAEKFNIPFYEIYITGSAKLGFSPFKRKEFDLNSDIDIALVSPFLFEEIMNGIAEFQEQFRKNRRVVRKQELDHYHDFLEYVALGWIRPDKLPVSFQMKAFKDDWFKFFRGISNGKSEVGNYQVNAGVFKSYNHLEKYTLSGVQELISRNLKGSGNGASN